MNNMADEGIKLWDEEDEFFYDVLHWPDDTYLPMKIRSLVGLIPLCAVEMLEPHVRIPPGRYKGCHYISCNPSFSCK